MDETKIKNELIDFLRKKHPADSNYYSINLIDERNPKIDSEQLKETAYFINFNYNNDKYNSITNMAGLIKTLAGLFFDKQIEKEIDELVHKNRIGLHLSIIEQIYFKSLQHTGNPMQKLRVGKNIVCKYEIGALLSETKTKLYQIYKRMMLEHNVKETFDWGQSAIQDLKKDSLL
jgi:hypothetical protein